MTPALEYLLRVKKSGRDDIEIGPVALRILEKFAQGALSAYQIYRIIKKTSLKIEYKNVHKRVKRLHELGLIGQVKSQITIRGAIYYKLTPIGLYYFIKKNQFSIFAKNIFLNYSNDELLSVFIYPFIDPETIIKIDHFSMYSMLFLYLHDCVIFMENQLMIMRGSGLDYDTPVEDSTKYGHTSQNDLLSRFLKTRLNIDLILPKIEKNPIKRTVTFSDSVNIVTCSFGNTKFLTVSIKKRKPTLAAITRRKFPLKKINFQFKQINPTTTYLQVLSEILSGGTYSYFVDKIATAIIMRVDTIEHEGVSLRYLSLDKKFMKIVDDICVKTEKGCKKILVAKWNS